MENKNDSSYKEKLLKELNSFKEKQDRTLTLPDKRVITFNDDQYEGVLKIREWLLSNDLIFTLSGFSGSGKTTVLKKILDEYRRSVVVSAPTHKAKRVIAKITNCDGVTLHSLLGLRPDVSIDEFNPNDPKFNQIALPNISKYKLVIIDEASMINEELFELIKKEISIHKTKVLFVGDPAQIPPIGERMSIVFDDNSPSINKHHLSKVMRQADSNPLFEIYDKLRDSLEIETGGFKRVSNINSKGEGVIFTKDKDEFREILYKHFRSEELKKDIDYVKLLAWRNDSVMASNKIIREGIFGKKPKLIEVGDILMAYRTHRAPEQYFNLIENSNDYRVIRVSEEPEENEFNLMVYRVTVEEKDLDDITYKKINVLDTRNKKNLHDYAEIHDGLKFYAKRDKEKWKDYYNFRRENLIMCDIKKNRDGSSRDYMDFISKDLDYSFSVTCHKAQGSTYQHVMILEDDISLNPKTKEMNQIKYVALSRPTQTATVLTHMK